MTRDVPPPLALKNEICEPTLSNFEICRCQIVSVNLDANWLDHEPGKYGPKHGTSTRVAMMLPDHICGTHPWTMEPCMQ